jgi:hypothetical protein
MGLKIDFKIASPSVNSFEIHSQRKVCRKSNRQGHDIPYFKILKNEFINLNPNRNRVLQQEDD